jgi:hypothetical protein
VDPPRETATARAEDEVEELDDLWEDLDFVELAAGEWDGRRAGGERERLVGECSPEEEEPDESESESESESELESELELEFVSDTERVDFGFEVSALDPASLTESESESESESEELEELDGDADLETFLLTSFPAFPKSFLGESDRLLSTPVLFLISSTSIFSPEADPAA